MTTKGKHIRESKRPKVKGRRSTEPFIGIPRSVLDSTEFGALSAHATKLAIELARQFRGKNNGDFSAAWSQMVKRGWHSPGTLSRAKKELLESGFAVVTRQGGRNCCSLFALTWWAVDECGGKHDEPPGNVALRLWTNRSLDRMRTSLDHMRTNQAVNDGTKAATSPDTNQSGPRSSNV